MKYEEADFNGSFVALGIAFGFEYNAPLKILSILNASNGRPLCYIDLDKSLSGDPKTYIRLIERTSQIEALKISSNATLDLTQTLDEERLAGILTTIALLARYAYDLEQSQFKRFERHFCKESGLSHLQIKQFNGYEPSSRFYTAYLETERHNAVSARSTSLPGLMHALAYKIVHDLLIKETDYIYEKQNSSFIWMSSKLVSLNQILNKDFLPVKRIAGNGHIPLTGHA